MAHTALNTAHREGFPSGLTWIDREEIDFGILNLENALEETTAVETAWILLNGRVKFQWAQGEAVSERTSLFDENPTTFHVPRGTSVKLSGRAELAIARTPNTASFIPKVFSAQDVATEFRGQGLVQDACLRQVKLVFDKKTRPEANLVIGEVVNYPGRWSSYPPHHHAQPELYHYRFTHPQGYGHAELGEEVFKIKSNDTLRIPPNLDHSQVSAPGYGMYYLWVVKHLPSNPYLGFEFTAEHKWLLDPKNQGWQPKEGKR
jgi:5-deoxy-glucuronate isomerase